MDAKQFLNIRNIDAPIFRIFTKSRFLDLCTTHQNELVNPSKWDDPFENFFLQADVRSPLGKSISMTNLAADWYGQCWTYNEDTDAMWRIYSHSKDGIKVQTTIRKLFSNFYDAKDRFAQLKFIGEVEYSTKPDIVNFMGSITFQDVAFGGESTKFAELLCIKREAFEHEREVRLLFQDVDPKQGAGGVALFNFDPNAVLDGVVLDPRLPDGDAVAIEAEIRATGCTVPISRSPLYRVPAFTIPLQ